MTAMAHGFRTVAGSTFLRHKSRDAFGSLSWQFLGQGAFVNSRHDMSGRRFATELGCGGVGGVFTSIERELTVRRRLGNIRQDEYGHTIRPSRS